MKSLKPRAKLTLILLGAFFSWCMIRPVFAEEEPIFMLQNVTNQIMKELKTHRQEIREHPNKIYQLVEKLIVPYVDFSEMARWVVGRNAWQSANLENQKEFIEEFKTMVIRSYARSLLEYTDQKIEFLPLREAVTSKSRIEVLSLIKDQGKSPIRMNYHLIRRENKWLVYDIIIEGVSLMQGYRAQFAQDAQQGGMQLIIRKMRNHNEKH